MDGEFLITLIFIKKIGADIKIIDKVLIDRDKIKIKKINSEFKKYDLDDLRVKFAGIIVLKNNVSLTD